MSWMKTPSFPYSHVMNSSHREDFFFSVVFCKLESPCKATYLAFELAFQTLEIILTSIFSSSIKSEVWRISSINVLLSGSPREGLENC